MALASRMSDLALRYSEPHRHYHTLEHVVSMLRLYREMVERGHFVADEAIELAIWYHDAVYDPQRSDNEERSVWLLEEVGKDGELGDDGEDVARACEMVLATKDHGKADADPATALFLDLDLAVLGSSPSEYARYQEGIRLEYRHLDSEAYVRGRTAVVERFLSRLGIFHTSVFADRFEARARENLERELRALREGGH